MGMKIAITGGEGFIGKRLIPLLTAAGHECFIIDKVHASPVDVRNLSNLTSALAGIDAVYHLAAEHADNVTPVSLYHDVNVVGMQNLLAAADAHNIKRIIFTSSFAVYGLNTGCPNEDAPARPFNEYGKTKWEAEEVLQQWARKNPDAKITIVRPVVVFGEGNRGNVYNLIDQMARGRFMMVGSGKNKKSIAYVGNVADFLSFLLPRDAHLEIFNYADKPDLNMKDFVSVIYSRLGRAKPSFAIPYAVGLFGGFGLDIVSRLTGKKFPISAVRIQKFCADTVSDSTRSMSSGFAPRYSLEDGLARMIDHEFNKIKDAD
jgi:nucleoside-diphosphate-sugar epimerase